MPVLIPDGGATPTPVRFSTSSLVEETLLDLAGHTLDMGQMTWLTQDISDSATTLMVDATDQIFRGVAEVGDELVQVASSSDSGVVLFPNGRGVKGTIPQAWPKNTTVTFGPRFPRHTVLQTINDVLLNTFPLLWAVGETEFSAQSNRGTYELPTETQEVLSVSYRPVTPTGNWETISRYRFNPNAGAEYTTGKTIELPPLQAGRTIQVRYTKKPTALTALGSFEDSGLETTAWPAVKYGALHRLVATLTMGRLESDSAQGAEYNLVGRRPVAVEVSREYYALHQQFLNEERTRLLEANPVRMNYRR